MNAPVAIPLALLSAPDRLGGRPTGECLVGMPVWDRDRLAELTLTEQDPRHILLPRLAEPHVHFDKCHTLHRVGPVGGDLAAAIAAQRADKSNWTAEDISARAARGLAEARAAGCAAIRTHVDWGDEPEPPLAWQAIGDLDAPELQRAALTGIEQMAEPEFAAAVAKHVAAAGGALGAFILHHDRDKIRAGLRHIFAEALRHDLMVDFHVDEGHGRHNGLELIADAALDCGFDGPILCGHAVSLMDRSAEDVARIADKLARAGITVCALPTTNLYLQDRREGTPDRRGLTRLRELDTAGVAICVGSDNVQDAFCPTGTHDPMAALNLAILTGHLDPPLGRWLPLITTHPARALGREPDFVDTTPSSDLLVAEACTLADVISGQARLRPLTEKDIQT